jgi:hypothetical protein
MPNGDDKVWIRTSIAIAGTSPPSTGVRSGSGASASGS